MDKGQHLRLVITSGTSNAVIALATTMSLHLSAQTEDSTTKDTTDTTGAWNEYDVTGRSGEIQFGALVASGTDAAAKTLADAIDGITDTPINWKIALVSGTNNRTVGKTVCSGQGKFTNVSISAQNRQKATYTGTINIYGAVAVGAD